MAAMDFPNSPTVGDLFGSTGTVWRWDGARWVSTSGPSGARGVVGYVTKTSGTVGLSPTVTDITGLSVTFNAQIGRLYRISAFCGAVTVVGSTQVVMAIKEGATQLAEFVTQSPNSNGDSQFPTAIVTFSTGVHTIKATGILGAGGAGNAFFSAGSPGFLLVEDITYEAGATGPGGSPVIIENAQYTPTIVSGLVLGTGGTNIAEYTFIGPTGVGAVGSLAITHNVVLGTSGSSVSGPPIFELPPGFSHAGVVSSAQLRYGLATIGSSIGAVQWNSGAAFAYVVLNASTTYAGATSISSTIPLTWGASDTIRSSFVIPQVVRI